jgi:hypothetical protein
LKKDLFHAGSCIHNILLKTLSMQKCDFLLVRASFTAADQSAETAFTTGAGISPVS